jgi:DegV family protein with EDD domain
VATTAQTATGVMVETIEKMLEKGYEEILIITISSMLSGTYSGAVMAANMIDHDHIHVFDSKSVAYPEARMALDAAEMAARGKSVEEILKHLAFIRDHHGIYFSVDTLKYLVKNGRLSGASGFVGGLLKIKPLLMLTEDGRVESIEKIRTSSKSLNRVVEKFLEDIEGKDVEAFIIHAEADSRVEDVKKELKKRKSDLGELSVYPLTPVVGAHAGPGVVALGYIEKP